MLSILNAHARDARIVFTEEGHYYTVDGARGYTSTTTFIKYFFEAFDADKILEKMRETGSFERKYSGKTNEQVKEEWEANRDAAAARGTRLHKFIEDFFNGTWAIDPTLARAEVHLFDQFVRSIDPRLEPYRTEWYIFDETHRIAGSIDMLFRRGNEFVMYDWKCTKGLKFRGFRKPKPPVEELEDCNFTHYALQQNMYKYILETKYHIKVAEMYLLVLHHSNLEPKPVTVPNMQRTIEKLLQYRARN